MAEDKQLLSAIASILGETPEEDRPALGNLRSLKQVIADAAAAKKRTNLRRQHEEDLRAMLRLNAEAKANNDRVKALKVEKAMAKAEADSARASVEELKARLAEAEGGLAVKTAKIKGATSALEVARAKQVSLAAEGNRLVALTKTPVPGNPKDDEATAATPRLLVADASRIVKKLLRAKA